ncbi:MAG: MBL fold metallo-hydrolase, partial [Halobacteriovoraceae bacterium]|nr:MBL fold metallo-hydrolase [Halobacteriovoraceae bacterium]
DQITNFPVTLLLSHFHFDHSQNISEFSKIAFPDLPILKQRVSKGNIFKFTAEDLFIGSYPSQVKINKWLPVNSDIDLGNRVIQIISIPGHATESIGIIDKTNKMAFLGDYLYNGELFLFNNDDLKKYLESVNYLISILDADYKLFGAHGNAKVEFEKLLNLKTFLECINSGKCQGRSTILFGYDVKVYEHLEMHIVIFQLPNFQS